MRKVKLENPPGSFKASVSTPGNAWLKKQAWYDDQHPEKCYPEPVETKDFPPTWRNILHEIHQIYHGICSYYGIYIPPILGAATVDHFLPKSLYPGLAYRWSNYRLACSLANRRKGQKTGLIDPFDIEGNWFYLDFTTFIPYANPELSDHLRTQIQTTIHALGMDKADYTESLKSYYKSYLLGEVEAEYLENKAPYLWSEIVRQGMFRRDVVPRNIT